VDSGVEGKISYLEESITTYLKVQIFERKTEAFKATHNLALDISKSEKLFSRIATKFKAELQNKIHYIIKNQDLLGSNHFFYPDSYRRYIQDT